MMEGKTFSFCVNWEVFDSGVLFIFKDVARTENKPQNYGTDFCSFSIKIW